MPLPHLLFANRLYAVLIYAVLTLPIITGFSAETPSTGPKASARVNSIIDQMPQSSLQEAFRHLKEEYIKKENLTYDELNRAALQGLLERLDFGGQI